MRKALSKTKISGPSKLLRRVLSKTSTASNASKCSERETDKMPVDLEFEINNLKEQIEKLQLMVNNMQSDSEKKEEAIAVLAREKEELTCDLHKEKRLNKKLKQQLEDERDFYYREKESYCKEMNECKKLKKNLQGIKGGVEKVKELEQTKSEIGKLKEVLQQTLESNYNLSVKFLRMKNTKYGLKNRLKQLQSSHDKLKVECQTKLGQLNNEMSELVNSRLNTVFHPSNKKYLKVVQHNGTLIHENMCLQLEIDRLHLEIERLKMMELRRDTNSKLKYINTKTKANNIMSPNPENLQEVHSKACSSKHLTKPKEHAVDADVSRERVNLKAACSRRDVKHPKKSLAPEESQDKLTISNKHSSQVVKKIYERKQTKGTPTISLLHEELDHCNLPDDDNKKKATRDYRKNETKKCKREKKEQADDVKRTPQKQSDEGDKAAVAANVPPSTGRLEASEGSMQTFCGSPNKDKPINAPATPKESKSDLSECSYYPPSEAIRTQSAPEIVQSSCFVNQT